MNFKSKLILKIIDYVMQCVNGFFEFVFDQKCDNLQVYLPFVALYFLTLNHD